MNLKKFDKNLEKKYLKNMFSYIFDISFLILTGMSLFMQRRGNRILSVISVRHLFEVRR